MLNVMPIVLAVFMISVFSVVVSGLSKGFMILLISLMVLVLLALFLLMHLGKATKGLVIYYVVAISVILGTSLLRMF